MRRGLFYAALFQELGQRVLVVERPHALAGIRRAKKAADLLCISAKSILGAVVVKIGVAVRVVMVANVAGLV